MFKYVNSILISATFVEMSKVDIDLKLVKSFKILFFN